MVDTRRWTHGHGGHVTTFMEGEKMLKEVQARRIAICVAKKTRGDSDEVLAREFGVSVPTIRKALEWGRNSGLYELDNAQQVEVRIVEVSDTIARLEELLDKCMVASHAAIDLGEKRALTGDVVPLAKEIREQRILLMELQGLYRQNMNIQIEQKNNVLVLPQTVSDMDEWLKAVREVQRGDLETTAQASIGSIS